jgi:peptidoglycan/LPS O-acetylase OafA/YrhL
MVLAYHVGVPGSSGGFAGVDVFFVISGYLITNQLVREAQQHGRVSLPRFYARRARRLLPAATTVLVVTTVTGWFVLPRGRHEDLGAEVLAATGYVVNWLLASREVDYLAEDQSPSLVQHYWSLSVEEQFYVVWPLLIIAILWLARRLHLRFLPVLTVALVGLVVASAAWSVVHTAASPGTAYFATTTRAWQLGVGALLVLLTPLLARLSRPSAAGAAWLGLLLIGVTFVVISTRTPWPGSAAALPTLGTAAVIAAGIAWPGSPPARLLGVAPMRFLGAISYGLYLWHWPALRLLEETHPDARLHTRIAVGLLSVLLAWLTLRLVENPVRYHPRLAASAGPALTGGAVAMATSAALAAALMITAPSLDSSTMSGSVGAMSLVDPKSRTDAQLRPAPDVQEALVHTDSPVPDPAVADEDISLAYREGCQVSMDDTEFKPLDDCWFGDPDGTTTVALVGDSKMEQWSSAIHTIALSEGWRVKAWTKSACGFVDEERSEVCHDYNRELSALLGQPEHAPDLIFTSLGTGYPTTVADSFVAMLEPARRAGAEVVFLADTPALRPRGVHEDVTSLECLDRFRDDYAACWAEPLPGRGSGLLAEVSARLEAPSVDLFPWICPRPEDVDGCSPVVGGVVVNRRGGHLTETYVDSLTPILHHELATVGVADTPLDQIDWQPPSP